MSAALAAALLLATITASDIVPVQEKPGFVSVGNSLHARAGGGFEFRFAPPAGTSEPDSNTTDPAADARTVSAMTSDLRRAFDEIRTAEITAARIAGPLAASIDELRADTDRLAAAAARIRTCIADHAAPGPAGSCIPLVSSCPGLPAAQGISIAYSPASLAYELLAGTMASFGCTRPGMFIDAAAGQPTAAVCLSSGRWNGSLPSGCTACTDQVPHCVACNENGVCDRCNTSWALVTEPSTGRQQCVVPPGSRPDNPAVDCNALQRFGLPSGPYWLTGNDTNSSRAPPRSAVLAYCDQHTLGGGWTLVFSLQEQSPEGGLPPGYAGDASTMWIKGCGHQTSAGCDGRGPDTPSWRHGWLDEGGPAGAGAGSTFRSLDWRLFLQEGEEYDIRQAVGVGQQGDGGSGSSPIRLSGGNNNYARDLQACDGECDADGQCAAGLRCFQRSYGEQIPGCSGLGSGPTWDYCYDPSYGSAVTGAVVDVAYRFTYPGFVLQDDAGDDETAGNLTWALSDQRIIADTTEVAWDPQGEAIFFPPWSTAATGNVACAYSSFFFGNAGSVRFAVGSAGITNSNGLSDPAGVAWLPHVPRDHTNCAGWGPHQGGIRRINNWCGQPYFLATYWIRRASGSA